MAAAALVLVTVATVLGVGSGRAEAASCSEAVPSGQIRVVIVVDPGAVGGPSAACLVVPAGTTGAQALARRASDMGSAVPRYNGSGLLCAIDGYPGSGCGDRNSSGYLYWAYFSGSSGSWVYGNFNPFTKRLVDGDIEGWRFVDGAGDGSEPPPRIGPTRSLFPAVTTATTAAPVLGDTSGSGSASSGAAPAGSAIAPGGAGTEAGTEVDGTVSPGAVGVTATTVAADAGDVAVELAGAPVGSARSGGSWIAVAVVVALIAGLGGAAYARSRARG